MRTLVKLLVVGLIGFALVQTVPVFWSYVQFRDAVGEMARFSGKRKEADVVTGVMQLAERFDVPLDRASLSVRRENATTYVDASYTAEIQIIPSYFYTWEFSVQIEGTPAAYTQVIP
jgi:hypothetical protein